MSSRPPPDDDERTVLRPTIAVDSQLGGFVTSSSFLGHTLPEGTVIGGLEITGLIGEGGFGIVYLAYDSGLQRQVAIKEYMPSSLAARASGSMEVQVKSERHADTFKAGLKSFVNEARLLARFDHDSLVKVFRFWEANGTAYMAMPYYEGPTLKRALAELPAPPDEDQLRRWLHPILDALAVMHHAHCFHRDIAPDNILLTASGPLLLDFGAARRVIGDMTHALTVVLKPGYAPIEQYGDSPNMAQGAWTDLYALACVVYYAIMGKAPMSSVERLMGDRLQPLSRIAAGRYSEAFLRAIDSALAVKPQERPQDVAQFRALLDAGSRGAAPPAAPKVAPLPTPQPPPEPPPRTAQLHADVKTQPIAPPIARTVAASVPSPPSPSSLSPESPPRIERTAWATEPAVQYREEPAVPTPRPVVPPAAPPKVKPAPVPAPAGEPRDMRPYAIGGGAAVLALSAALLYNAMRTHAPETPQVFPPDSTASAAMPASAAVPAPVPIPSSNPAPTPAPTPAATTAPATAPASAPVVIAAPAAAPAPAVEASAPSLAVTPAPAASATIERPTLAEVVRKPRPQRPPPEVRKAIPKPQSAVEAPPTKPSSRPARCSDILQKASLETLNAEEAAFLRRECR
ncbi:MAG TPA: serine/threonine-protein kinase [Albitalea sp.]|nr:serine/threonine-protein kinase [Albitalea sp.]